MLGFRVWDNEYEKFRGWQDCYISEKGELFRDDSEVGFGECLNTELKRFIPMQSTGVYDINGNEIYEKDIVSKTAFAFNIQIVECVDNVTDFLRNMPRNGFNYTLNIIGNIYENPELLERLK